MRTERKPGSRGVPRAVREEWILDVAGRAFAELGYHAASMDDIAAAADVTKPVVYAYFRSKEELYVAYIERAGRELLGRMRDAADPGGDPLERLRDGTLQFLRFVDERRNGWQVLYSEASMRGGPLADELAGLRERIARMIGRLLVESAAKGRPSKSTRLAFDGVAHGLVGAGESLANWWLVNPDVPPERIAGWLLEFARAGVEHAPER